MPTLTESYVDLFGPVSGRVQVTAGSERESAAGGSRVVPRAETVRFSGGTFTLEGIEPGLVEVYVWIDDGPTIGRRVTVPAGDGEHRLTDLAPEAQLPNTSPYLTLAEVLDLVADVVGPLLDRIAALEAGGGGTTPPPQPGSSTFPAALPMTLA